MNLKIISICLLAVSVFISCEKEPEVLSVKNDVLLLSKVMIADKPYTEYSYNTDNLVSIEKGKYDFVENHYNESNQLISSDYYVDNSILSNDAAVAEAALSRAELINTANAVKGLTIAYEYNDQGQLIKTSATRPSVNYAEYSEFSYDANGRISRQTIHGEDKITGYNDYLYDDRGNLIKQVLYYVSSTGVTEVSTITTYEYDNKENPFRSISNVMKPGIATNKNNIIKETYSIQFQMGEGGEQVQLTRNAYQYNEMGYPTSKNGTIKYVYN